MLSFRTFLMPLLRLLIAGLSLSLSLSTQARAQALRVGYFDLPPHATQDAAGKASGAAVDMFRLVAQRMGVPTVNFQQLPLPRLLKMLDAGELDAILLLVKNPEREAKYFFPAKSLYQARAGLAVAASSKLTVLRSPDALQGMRIGIFLGQYLSPSMRQAGLNLELVGGGQDMYVRNFKKLMLGRLDAVYAPDTFVLRYEAKVSGVTAAIRIVELPEPATPGYTVFNKKAAASLGARYEKAQEAVIKERGDYVSAFLRF
jgi:polar amino acid transport system substrate-binding protein